MEGTAPKSRNALGQVYTPKALADWAAELLMRNLPKRSEGNIVDPACGDGALLEAVYRIRTTQKLVGIDISREAIIQAKRKLSFKAKLLNTDALAPVKGESAIAGWKKLFSRKMPTALIANPPWGADLFHSTTKLKELGYSLAEGQFDSFELFMELSFEIVKPGGIMVFIIPDSIFQPEHEPLRRMLCTRGRLLLLARLGEGFFENVYRGTVVLVIKNEPPQSSSKVACMRLTREWRADILSGKRTFAEAEKKLVHYIPQSRFQKDSFCRFDIDLTEKEKPTISLLERYVDGWTGWLDSSRGVELSKSGRVIYCSNCGEAQPYPRVEQKIQCKACGHSATLNSARTESIVLPAGESPRGWKPFIVGEDVDRYAVAASRHIRPRVRGINYKSQTNFEERKIVVRKTGVGIKAAIDDSGSLTNQVVFLYRMNPVRKGPSFLLDYFLGVLCSRPMMAYHLKKQGENEWRSHPYLTQRIISELPVPNVKEGTWQWRQAQAIAEAVRKHAKSKSSDADVHIDRLVAGLFEFSSEDCSWVLQVLNSAQSLEPIKTLRLSDKSSLCPIRIS